MIRINLLGGEGKKNKGKKLDNIEINVKLLVIAAVFIIEIIALGVATYMLNNKLSNIKSEYNRLSSLENKVKSIKAKISEVNKMIRVIKKLENGRGRAAKILEEVADSMPNITYSNLGNGSYYGNGNLWFTKMVKKGNKVFIYGKSFAAEAVADYMMRLESLKDVKRVRFSGSGLKKVSESDGLDVYSFSIVVTLKE